MAFNIGAHLTSRRKPNGSQPFWDLSLADDMVIFQNTREKLQTVLADVK